MQLVTAVVLSLEKQDFLRSQLVYYSDKPIHLILADGSDTDWGSGESGEIGQMSWEYFRISGPNTYWLRMQAAVRKVNTKYLFLLDDEDCILWTGVVRAITFLQSNPSFSSAGGQGSSTAWINKRIGLSTAPRFKEYELSHPDAKIRLAQLLIDRRPAHLFYQIHTTQSLCALMNEMVQFPLHMETALVDKYLPIFLALTGTWKADSYPFLIRRAGKRNRATTTHKMESLSEADCREIAATVCSAALQLAKQNLQSGQSDFAESIAGIIHSRYKTFRIQGEMYHTTWKQKVATFLLFRLFDHFPCIYGLLRPNGLKTVSNYAKYSIDEASEVQLDLHFLERLWISHPNGVAVNELETLLKCNAEWPGALSPD